MTKSHTTRIVGALAVCLLGLSGCSPDLLEQVLGTKDGPLGIENLTPKRALVESNTVVMIEGEGFIPGMQVMFGDRPAKEVQVLTDGILTAMTPVHPIGKVDVRLKAQSRARNTRWRCRSPLTSSCSRQALPRPTKTVTA